MRKLVAGLLLLALLAARAQDPGQEEFEALDLNGDRRVSLAEAAGYANVVVRFDKADRNRDGKLTLAEFKRLKKLKIPVQAKAGARSAAAGGSGRRN
jgi:hypothetical protein